MIERAWTLSEFERKRILRFMKLLPGVAPSQVIRRLEGKMRTYARAWERHDSRFVHPTVKEMRGKDVLFYDRRHHAKPGRVPRDAMRAFVDSLKMIYKDATGKNLGRINRTLRRDPDEKLQKDPPVHKWKPNRFLSHPP
jgi:hypothetical protein